MGHTSHGGGVAFVWAWLLLTSDFRQVVWLARAALLLLLCAVLVLLCARYSSSVAAQW